MKTLVYGFFGKRNIGDECYKIAFPRIFPEDDFTFTEVLYDELVDAHDKIVLGGGNVLDHHHVARLAPYKGRKPIDAYSVSCTCHDLTPEEVAVFDKVTVRDFRSRDRVRALGNDAEYAPDAAFALTPDRENGERIVDTLTKTGTNFWKRGGRVGVVVNAHLVSDGQEGLARDGFRFQQFAYDLASVLDQLRCNGFFIPFMTSQPWDDRVTNGWVASKCDSYSKNVVLYDEMSPQHTLDLISAMDAVVSTRLHSAVFSTVANTPFIDVQHHDKTKWFLETIADTTTHRAVPYWDFQKTTTRDTLEGWLTAKNTER